MTSRTGGATRLRKTANTRSVLSDLNMLENSHGFSTKRCNSDSSSCDSSDSEEEPVVKRPRKTTSTVLNPSKILSSIDSQSSVYSTVAKKSFEEINSYKYDFSKQYQEEKDKPQNVPHSKSNDDLIIIESEDECSPQESKQGSPVRDSSPEPPSPPPSVVSNIRRTRGCSTTRNLKMIQSSLIKIDKALNSQTCSDQSFDDSLVIMDEEGGVGEDDINREIVVMVKIGSQIKRFPMRRTDNFSNLFSFLAQEKEVPESQLMLLLNEKTIHQSETPASIHMQIADILDCLITDEENEEDFSERTGPNVISLVIQSSINQKSKKTMQIGKFEPLQGIIDMYAKQHKLLATDLKLRFDGEIIDTSTTPADLDMEDEDCVDLIKV